MKSVELKIPKEFEITTFFFLFLSQTQFYRRKRHYSTNYTKKPFIAHGFARTWKKNLSQRYHVRLVDILFIEAERFFFTSKCIWPMSFLLRKKSKFYGKLNISWKMCEDRLRNIRTCLVTHKFMRYNMGPYVRPICRIGVRKK